MTENRKRLLTDAYDEDTKESEDTREATRIAIAAFIVGTTLTIMASDFTLPKSFLIPVGAFLFGLIATAVLAFLFILAKGYELRYHAKKSNVFDKYNYILYNAAMTAYVIIMGVTLSIFLLEYLEKGLKAGDMFASFILGLIFVSIVIAINWKDLKDLVSYLRKK